MTKKNILVFPCGTEIGLDIYNAVKYSRYFHLIGLNSVDDHGRFVYEDYIGVAPFITDERFKDFLTGIIKDRHIDAIFPTNDLVISVICGMREELECEVIAPPTETTAICLSKKKTYALLKDTVRVPKVYEDYDVDSYPVFVKPDVGHSSIGTEKICDGTRLREADPFGNDKIVVEYLPGEEYTIDCFSNSKGELLFCKARSRNRTRIGISVNTSYVEGDEYRAFAEKTGTILKQRGAWFVQAKRDKEGELCLLEVAARMGGSSALSLALGVNIPLLTLFDAFGYDTEVIINDVKVESDKAFYARYKCDLDYDEVYVDYDDCLILDGSVINHELVGYLYKCVSEGKKVYLLTKHIGDLDAELKKYRLDHLFDEIILITPEDNKKDYIRSKRSIFIDDSHAERKNIRESLGISVFGPEMVTVLMG